MINTNDNKNDNNHDNKSENKNEKKNDNTNNKSDNKHDSKNGNKSDNKNARRLKKSYEKLCTVTFQKTKQLDENADIKIIKDAFSAVKEGINIGLLLDRENEGENTLRVIFEGLTDETSV